MPLCALVHREACHLPQGDSVKSTRLFRNEPTCDVGTENWLQNVKENQGCGLHV